MEIKPQDTVLIKEWDELEQEYGVDNDGWIVTPGTQPYFLPDMKSLCGNLVKVEMLNDYEIRVRGVKRSSTSSRIGNSKTTTQNRKQREEC